jgi:hypothetical protein
MADAREPRLTMLRRRNRLLIARVLMALALVVAQTSAQAHRYSHHPADQPSAPTQLCGECLCFAPVLGTAPAPDHPFVLPRADVEPVLGSVRAPVLSSRPFHAFRSRAPPALL